MTQYVILLRGINVGGRNSLPMKELRDILEQHGCESVQTYIQSGNVVVSSTAPPDSAVIATAIESRFGFAPRVLVIPGDCFAKIAEANPYKDEEVEGKSVHISYLDGEASADIAGLEACKSVSEEFVLTTDAFYLFAPEGIGRSRLASRAEKLLGVEATSRNWNTVRKLLEMLA